MNVADIPSVLYLTLLMCLVPYHGGFVSARSHHRHQHHHHVSGSNSGPASLRNREEAGALPFTESRFPESETLTTRSLIGPRYPAENLNSVKPEGFPAPRPAYPQMQRQQNFNPANIQAYNNNNQQPQPNFYARAPQQQTAPFNAPKEKASSGGSETGKWASNHTIPFLKKLMGEVDEGKIKHHDYPALTWFLKYFAEQYPGITRLYSIGMNLLFGILSICGNESIRSQGYFPLKIISGGKLPK